jgi:hypothetical protein
VDWRCKMYMYIIFETNLSFLSQCRGSSHGEIVVPREVYKV